MRSSPEIRKVRENLLIRALFCSYDQKLRGEKHALNGLNSKIYFNKTKKFELIKLVFHQLKKKTLMI
jgi:hypothetical protein